MKLGVSLYPKKEQETDIRAYLSLASNHGVKKVFTSMFSMDEEVDINVTFKRLCDIAHEYGMEVSADVNPMLFERIGARYDDLSVFKNIGVDSLRLDMPFNDERDAFITKNDQGITIEFSAMMKEQIIKAVDNGADTSNMIVCHNFYPQRYTAPDTTFVSELNDFYKKLGIRTSLFITSQNEEVHGPWAYLDGLCTIEEHRNLPADVQYRHLKALDNVDEVLFGNAFASEEEFRAISEIEDLSKGSSFELPEMLKMFKFKNTHILKLDFDDISEAERKVLMDFPSHADMGDGSAYMLRSRLTRFFYGKEDIPVRTCDKEYFTRGDVLIVNNSMEHYKTEIQIVLKDMRNDGMRNYLGTMRKEELFLIDYIKPFDIFKFV